MNVRPPLPLILGLLLSACASGGGPEGRAADGAGPKADGAGATTTLARCWIEAGSGVGATDLLTCADDGSSGATVDRVEVVLASGDSRLIDLAGSERGEVSIGSDAYPLTLELMAELTFDPESEGREFWLKRRVERAEDLEAARGFAAPYDLWTIVVDNRTAEGDVGFDGRTLFLEGAEVPGSEDGTLEVPATNEILDAGEIHTFVLAVTPGTAEVRGAARDLSATDVLTPFTLDAPGRYTLTEEGLVPADETTEPASIADGSDAVRCGPFDVEGVTHVTCQVVTRPGVELADANVTRDGESVPLPTDGTVIDLGPLDDEARIYASLQLASGIDGLGQDVPPVEGEIVVDASGAEALTFPFDLIHVEITVDDEVWAAMFDGPRAHVVELSRRWGDRTRIEYQLRRRLSAPAEPHLWVAVSPGVTHVAGDVAVFETETPVRYPTVLVDGERWRVTEAGPLPD